MTLAATASLRPQPGEYAPYYEKYLSQIESNDILSTLDDQRRQMLLLLSGRTEADGDLRYAPDKWSLKEVLGHINDTERIMAYRALRIARGDAHATRRLRAGRLRPQWPVLRQVACRPDRGLHCGETRHHYAVRNLDEAAFARRGVANKNDVTVRALAYIIAGHELHHRRIIEEKYLK